MDYKKLQSLLEEVLSGSHDHKFDEVLAKIHCMSRPRVYGVLNAIVSCMEPGELYVEVGTYQGGSLISALLGNEARAIGVDSFSEFQTTNNYQQTLSNLESFGVAGRVELVNSGFKEFFAAFPADLKIQVYYYDGAHDYETQFNGMDAAWSYMTPGSIILVDDYFYPEVNRAVNEFVSHHPNSLTFQFVMLPFEGLDGNWWNGCVVMRVVGKLD